MLEKIKWHTDSSGYMRIRYGWILHMRSRYGWVVHMCSKSGCIIHTRSTYRWAVYVPSRVYPCVLSTSAYCKIHPYVLPTCTYCACVLLICTYCAYILSTHTYCASGILPEPTALATCTVCVPFYFFQAVRNDICLTRICNCIVLLFKCLVSDLH